MKGQWIGQYTGSSAGMIVVNVDERPSQYTAVVYLIENDKSFPSTAASFRTSDKNTPFNSCRT